MPGDDDDEDEDDYDDDHDEIYDGHGHEHDDIDANLSGEEGGKPVLTKTEAKQQRSQKKDVEAEILRNIDEEVA